MITLYGGFVLPDQIMLFRFEVINIHVDTTMFGTSWGVGDTAFERFLIINTKTAPRRFPSSKITIK